MKELLTSEQSRTLSLTFAHLAYILRDDAFYNIALQELQELRDDGDGAIKCSLFRELSKPDFTSYATYLNIYGALHCLEDFVKELTGESFMSPNAKSLVDQLEKIIRKLQDFNDPVVVNAALLLEFELLVPKSKSLAPDRAKKLMDIVNEIIKFEFLLELM